VLLAVLSFDDFVVVGDEVVVARNSVDRGIQRQVQRQDVEVLMVDVVVAIDSNDEASARRPDPDVERPGQTLPLRVVYQLDLAFVLEQLER
jgi:hypothetical protein